MKLCLSVCLYYSLHICLSVCLCDRVRAKQLLNTVSFHPGKPDAAAAFAAALQVCNNALKLYLSVCVSV